MIRYFDLIIDYVYGAVLFLKHLNACLIVLTLP